MVVSSRQRNAGRRRKMPTNRTTASLKNRRAAAMRGRNRRKPGLRKQRTGPKKRLSARQIAALRLLARKNAARGRGKKDKASPKGANQRGYRNFRQTSKNQENRTTTKTLKRRVLKGQGNATGRRRKKSKR